MLPELVKHDHPAAAGEQVHGVSRCDREAVEPPTHLVDRLARCRADYYRALDLPTDTYAAQAWRADELADVCTRTAEAWAAVARWCFGTEPGLTPGAGVHWVFASAVTVARRREQSNARFWRDTARFWRADGMQAADAATVATPVSAPTRGTEVA